MDFIERLFNLWPDGGSGSTELIAIGTVFLIAVAAIWRWRILHSPKLTATRIQSLPATEE